MKSLYIDIIAKFFLIISGLSMFFLNVMNIDLLKPIQMNNYIKYILGLLIGFSTFKLMFDRNFYLPFLGKCVFPSNVNNNLPPVTLDKKTDVKLTKLPPNTTIIYWATKKNNTIFDDYKEAYKQSSNVGYAKSDNNGEVIIKLDCPSQYKVPVFGIPRLQKTLYKHVHYRYLIPEFEGMYSKVYTQKIDC